MKRLATLIAFFMALSVPSFGQTANDVKTKINAVPWTNGVGGITGGALQGIMQSINSALVTYAPSSATVGEVYQSEIGDSRAAQCSVNTGTPGVNGSYRNSPIAFCGWPAFLTGQNLRHPASYNCAATGTQTSAMMGQFTNCVLPLNPRPKIIFNLSGTNDFANGVTAAAAWANFSAVVTAERNAGMVPFCIYDLTRQLSTWTSADAQQSNQFNELMRMNGPGLGCIVIDSNYQLADPNNIGDPKSGYSPDGIHTTPVSAILIGNNVVSALQNLGILPLANAGTFTVAAADLYSSTGNIYGNKISNPLFVSTGGTNTGSGASGTVPANWSNRTLTGTSTAVSTVPSRSDGKPGNCWQVVITETSTTNPAAGRLYFTSNLNAGTDYTAGDKMWFGGDLSWSGATGLWDLNPSIQDFDAGSLTYDYATAFNTPKIVSTNYPFPTAGSGRFRTDTITTSVSAPSSFVTVYLDWTLAASGSATIKFCAPEVRATP